MECRRTESQGRRTGPRRGGTGLVTSLLVMLLMTGGAAATQPGDLDGNGAVDGTDRALMGQLLAGNLILGQVAFSGADVNEDGQVTVLDGAWLLLLDPPYRGRLLSCQAMGSITRSQADFLLLISGMSELRPARFGAGLYAVRYRTVSPWGGAVPASGLMTLPTGLTGALPWVSYQHGTLTLRTEAPSNPESLDGQATAIIYAASGGYAAVAADYLGLGDSPGRHPYLHADSEASAALDLMRAARAAAADEGVSLTGLLFLAGYSQGGHATMALHRELEARFAGEFPVAASAPMAGPYDLSGTMLDYMMGGAPDDHALCAYLAYCVYAYHLVYGVGPALADLFQPPYDGMVADLFDGTHSFGEIAAVMPPNYSGLLQPSLVAAVQSDPADPLGRAMRLNDVYDWSPLAPLRMYHSLADSVVPHENAEVALQRMEELGGNASLVTVSTILDHGAAAIPCLVQSRLWFDSLRGD